jgi:hypothetical protein
VTAPDVLAEADLHAFRAADYPCRVMVLPQRAAPDAPVSICWLPVPWAPATIEGMVRTFAAGGGLCLLAREPAALLRMREAVEMLIVAPAGSA